VDEKIRLSPVHSTFEFYDYVVLLVLGHLMVE